MKPMVSTQLMFQNYHKGLADNDFFLRELSLAKLADRLGYDALWCVEHHFDDYAMCPDNFQALSWLAPQTERIKLGIGAAILPWNDPLRVIEKTVMLDILSGGRALLAMGRGLARMEYEGFRQNMAESRDRFDEAARMVVRGLADGAIQNDGPFYPQPQVDIRPAPAHRYDDRLFAVAMSPDSVDSAAELGAVMMSFVQHSDEKVLASVDKYRQLFTKQHKKTPPPVVLTDLVFCHKDPAVAADRAERFIGQYFLSVIKHYDFAGEHFAKTQGYQSYEEGARLIREAGFEEAAKAYVRAQAWGTPEQILERYAKRRSVIGAFSANTVFSYAGLPYEEVEESMTLYAKEVMPALREMLQTEPKLAVNA